MLKIAWSELYCHSLPEGHRFPMEKYNLIPEQLIYEGTISSENLYDPGFAEADTVLLTHTEEYLHKLHHQQLTAKEIRKTGFPLSPQLVRRSFSIANGTIQNTLFAQQFGVAINGAGGTHHAFADRGEGFCLLNDIAIAANWLLFHQRIRRALVVDLDVHQGNGTAVIFQNDPRVFTFSMHCEANYPLHKEKSDLDIGLKPFTDDATYLKILQNTLPRLIQETEPDIVFYLSGVDILATDKLGKLACTRQGCKERDAYVLKLCHENRLPVVISLGGGYSHHIRDIVEAHCNTFRLAQEIWF
ncbi:MAG: histone deacetylase [Bacteroidia bacterium]|nr:histone deacetylase [Bacteroidia bacterium]